MHFYKGHVTENVKNYLYHIKEFVVKTSNTKFDKTNAQK